MRCFTCTAGILLVTAALACADESQKNGKSAAAADGDESSVADQIQEIESETSDRQRDIIKRYRAAEDDAEREKLKEEFNNLQSEKIGKYAEIADKHPNDEQIATLCLELVTRGAPAEKLYRVLIKKAKSHDTKGLAMLGLGHALSEQANADGIPDARRERLRKEAKEALRTVVSTYADVDVGDRKAGDMVGGTLFELEHLGVGLPVPDLEGEDLEAATFKLSDYRGKVVLLDFWAHW